MRGIRFRDLLDEMTSSLTTEQRCILIAEVSPDTPLAFDIIQTVVGSDPLAYQSLLDRNDLQGQHLRPLIMRDPQAWAQMVILALAARHSRADVALASFPSSYLIEGSEKDHWHRWAERFAELETHDDEGVRDVARQAAQHAVQEMERARDQGEQEERGGRWQWD